MTIEELTSKFHSLHGECVGQKRKSLNILLDEIKTEVQTVADLDLLISSIKPGNFLEEKFKLDILIHFNRYDEMLDVLKQGNVSHIGKILKCWEFFRSYEYFKSIDGATLVNDLLLQTSFKTRRKIINRLSKTLQNEKQADDLFEAILNMYGLKVATPLLTKCSTDTTKAVVKRYKILLTSRELLKIVKNDYSFLTFYYKNVYKNKHNEFSEAYGDVLKHVAKSDAALFWNLCRDHKFKAHFGKHMSPYILKCGRDVLSKNALHLEMFHPKEIIHERNFEQFFMQYYPKKVDDFTPPSRWSNMTKFLKYIPKEKKFDLVSRCFSEAYKKPLRDFPKMYTADVLAMMPVVEREVVLDQKIHEDQQLIYLYRPEKSIPMLQNRIKYTGNLAKRHRLISQLCKTCIFHKDEENLLTILKYIFARHKNDAASIKVLLDELVMWPNLYKLSEEHWIYINDFLDITEVSEIYFYNNLQLRETYIQHLIEKNRPFKEQLRELIKSRYEKHNYIQMHHPQTSVTLQEIAFLIPTTFEGEVLDQISFNFLETLINHNTYNSKDAVSIVDCHELIQAAKNMIKERDCGLVATYFIKKGIRFEEFDQIFWNNYENIYDKRILSWYSKHKPQKIADHMDLILRDRFGHLDDVILKTFTTLSQWEIPEKIVTYSVKVLKGKDYTCAGFAVKALSYFTTDSFFEAVEPFDPPADGKIDLAESQNIVLLQTTIAKCLRNIKQPELTVNLLLKFCIGDYLKHAPLHGVAHNLRNQSLDKLLSRLHNSAVSVRNHSVILKSTLCDKNTSYNFLKIQGSSEKNISLKTVIFMRTRKWFIEESDELFWNLFKDHLNIIDDENRDVHDSLLKIDRIPQNYLPQYVSLVYDKLLRNPNIDVIKKAYSLLSLIPDDVIEDIDINFLKRGIEDTLFKDNDSPYFCFKCIFHTNKTNQSILLNYTFDIFEKYVNAYWTAYVVGKVRNNVCSFINDFCTYCVQSKLENLVDLFHKRCRTFFDYKENLDESLLLNFTLAYCRCSFEKFGQATNIVLSELVTMYDESIIDIFCTVLTNFLLVSVKVVEEDELKRFLGSFYGGKNLAYTYIAMVKLLKRLLEFDPTLEVVKLLQQCELPTVQIYFNQYLRNV